MRIRFYSDTNFTLGLEAVTPLVPSVESDPTELTIHIPDHSASQVYEDISDIVYSLSGDIYWK